MRRVIADLESDGLLDELTVIHSLVLRDLDSDTVMSCADQPGYPSIEEGLRVLSDAERIYMHNGIRFDEPAILKLYPTWERKGKLMDTMVAAGTLWPEEYIKESDYARARAGKFPSHLAGSHSLAAWGFRLGVHKGEYTDWCKAQGIDPWSEWRPEMQTYCEGDTETTKALVLRIQQENPSPDAIETEHAVARYLFKQERNGWPFNVSAAEKLAGELSARRAILEQQLRETFGSWQVPDGKPFIPKRDNAKLGYTAGVAVQKYKTVEFNAGSRDHIAYVLKRDYGWEPQSFTKTGKPQVDDGSLKGLDYPPVKLLAEYLLLDKRLGQIAEGNEAWLKHARKHPKTGRHHIHGRVKANACITHRASHVKPNTGQVPKVGKPYGAECRALWDVPEGWVQIGADASGLELRCLAHYMGRWDNGAYAEVVLHGDIHTTNQKAAGLPTRDAAKTFIYAYLYGEGDEARGAKFLPPTASAAEKKKKGRQVAAQFIRGLPALGYLVSGVKEAAATQKFVLLPDNRRVFIRHQHAALNTLLQGAGAVICKRWIREFDERLTAEFGPQGWDGKWAALGWIHDEVQIAVRPEVANRVCEILVESIRHVGTVFNWRCPLDGEAKIGKNWKECH